MKILFIGKPVHIDKGWEEVPDRKGMHIGRGVWVLWIQRNPRSKRHRG